MYLIINYFILVSLPISENVFLAVRSGVDDERKGGGRGFTGDPGPLLLLRPCNYNLGNFKD